MAQKFFEDPDFENDEEEQPENVQPTPLVLRIIGKVIKYTFWAVILFVNVIIIWRMFSTDLPKEMNTLYVDTDLKNAYSGWAADADKDKGAFGIYQEYYKKHNMTTVEKDEANGIMGNYGYFGIAESVIFPDANQVQYIFRYNFSTLGHLTEDYGLAYTPSKYDNVFVTSLRVVTDDTPDNKDDDKTTETRYEKPYLVDTENRKVYCYYRYCVSDVKLENVVAIYVDIYYAGDVDFNREAYGSICIYSDDCKSSEYKLDKNDLKELSGD